MKNYLSIDIFRNKLENLIRSPYEFLICVIKVKSDYQTFLQMNGKHIEM